MENKDKQIISTKYVEHQDWFEKYHLYRDKFLETYTTAFYEDSNLIPLTMKYLSKYLMCVDSQLSLLTDTTINDKKEEQILDLYQQKEYVKTLRLIKQTFKDAEKLIMTMSLVPKPEIEIDETEKLDNKTKHALAAYDYLYP